MASRELERMVRTFVSQKLDTEYILHYLMETYQMDKKAAQDLLAKVSPPKGGRHGGPGNSDSFRMPAIRRSKFS